MLRDIGLLGALIWSLMTANLNGLHTAKQEFVRVPAGTERAGP